MGMLFSTVATLTWFIHYSAFCSMIYGFFHNLPGNLVYQANQDDGNTVSLYV